LTAVQWWCVARGEAWSWSWQAYPGVWLFVLLVALLYWRLTAGGSVRLTGVAGIVLLWLTLDWPAGALGAGYLASVHTLQYVLLSMVVPVLLLAGLGPAGAARISRAPLAVAVLARLTAPPFAAAFFTLVMAGTHAPIVLDFLMKSQAGSFALDMLWLGSGLLLAWPLVVSVPERPRFAPPLRMLYVFAGTVAHVFVGMWFLVTRFPVYATYELAPRIEGISAISDQHLAGAVILLIGSPIVLGAVTYIFFKWQGTGAELADRAGGSQLTAEATGGSRLAAGSSAPTTNRGQHVV
jgi:cytochrome c oxidase assembly factor CtaG